MDIAAVLSKEFHLLPQHVANVISLIDEGNTIPFIARYRKEMTGSMDDQVLRLLHERLQYLRNLMERKEAVIKSITEQDKLTPELEESIRAAASLQEVEDLYRPYKQKRRTRATIAKEKGLSPLAHLFLLQTEEHKSPQELAKPFLDESKGVQSVEDAILGAQDIIAEMVSDRADFRKDIRNLTFMHGILTVKAKKDEDSVYSMYYDFSEPLKSIAKHRTLAINRGEKEGFLSVSVCAPVEQILSMLQKEMVKNSRSTTAPVVAAASDDAYTRLIAPSIENELRTRLTEEAQEQSISLFATNLNDLLMQPPIKERVVLGLDPAYRTGCKIAVVDEVGKAVDTAVIYPTPPQNKTEEAKRVLKQLIDKHNVEIIAIGNGTAS